jgi:hypothetical protein
MENLLFPVYSDFESQLFYRLPILVEELALKRDGIATGIGAAFIK